MKIRAAHVDDAAALAAAVVAQPLLARYGASEDGLTRDLAAALARGDGLLVAEDDDGRLAGLAWYQLDTGLGLGGYLKLIALRPGAEGAGAGARLLDAVERGVAETRRRLFLLVSDFNEGAQRFYERRGYVKAGKLDKAILADVDELIYWKRL